MTRASGKIPIRDDESRIGRSEPKMEEFKRLETLRRCLQSDDSPLLIAARATAPSSHATTLAADMFVSLVAAFSSHNTRLPCVWYELQPRKRIKARYVKRACAHVASRNITSSLALRSSCESCERPALKVLARRRRVTGRSGETICRLASGFVTRDPDTLSALTTIANVII